LFAYRIFRVSDWANLFRYILQGFVTNELGGNEYFVDLSGIFAGLANATGIFGFAGATSSTARNQAASLISLAANGGNPLGANRGSFNVSTDWGGGSDLVGLVNCTMVNGCFSDEDQTFVGGFVECYIFNGIIRRPPCRDEFDAVIAEINATEVLKCFGVNDPNLPGFSVADATDNPMETEAPLANGTEARNLREFLPDFHDGSRNLQSLPELLPDIFNGTANVTETLNFIGCMMGALFPDVTEAIGGMIRLIARVASGVIPIFVNIVDQGGIYLPGDVILAFFGWAEWDGQQLSAPFKWWYCLGAVVIFLGGIEIFKLFAINFIVWTKR
jgi:hypothetical protein